MDGLHAQLIRLRESLREFVGCIDKWKTDDPDQAETADHILEPVVRMLEQGQRQREEEEAFVRELAGKPPLLKEAIEDVASESEPEASCPSNDDEGSLMSSDEMSSAEGPE